MRSAHGIGPSGRARLARRPSLRNLLALAAASSFFVVQVGGCPSDSGASLVAGEMVENLDDLIDGGYAGGAGEVSSQDGDGDSGGSGPLFLNAGGGFAEGEGGGEPAPGEPAAPPDAQVTAPTPNAFAQQLQTALDTTGYFEIPAGLNDINVPIVIRANMRLTGRGKASALRYVGTGNYAIEYGVASEEIYGAYLDSFSVSGGGLHLAQLAQTGSIEHMWISAAPGDGIVIDGIGERIMFRDVVSWGNAGNGCVIRMPTTNGIVFDHCNFQQNGLHGLLIEAVPPTGDIHNTIVRDCTIQSNCVAGTRTAEVLIRGLVSYVHFENLWIESQIGTPVGVRTETAPFGTDLYMPRGIYFGEGSTINLMTWALELDACYDCRIEMLRMTAGSRIRYRPYAPGGAQWMVPTGVIVPF